MSQQFSTREEWLNQGVALLRPIFFKRHLEIPDHVMVSCGFPSKGGLSENRTLGECWDAECTFNGTQHILISLVLGSEHAIEVLGVLTHELLHSTLPSDAKHGPDFKKGMKTLGLEGRAKHAMPGPELLIQIEKIAEELGEYPNIALKPRVKQLKDRAKSKKSFKLFCPKKRINDKSCVLTGTMTDDDYFVTASHKSLKYGFPLCPCSTELEMIPDDYELWKSLA